MPLRKVPLATDCFYHIFNRSIDKNTIFMSHKQYLRFIASIAFYKNFSKSISKIQDLKNPEQALNNILETSYNMQFLDYPEREILKKEWGFDKKVEILAYSIMPNHYHLFLKQLRTNGIEDFIKRIQSSYSLYFNKLNDRNGFLWQGNYKNVLQETEDQFIYLTKYIHINSKGTRFVKSAEDLKNYPYSSYREYLNKVEPSKKISNSKYVINDSYTLEDYVNYVETDFDEKLVENIISL